MARTLITEQEFESQFTLAAGFGDSSPIRFSSKIFDFYIEISPEHRELIFIDCEFLEPILFCKGVQLVQEVDEIIDGDDLFNEVETNVFSESVTFRVCQFEKKIQFDDVIFSNKFKIHNCTVNDASFRNTTFNDLADFWLTTFNKDIIFYKTDFNKTTVFSMARFIGNVLFTYSLFTTKVIFARTKFNKGVDLSQSIISGKLQPFDLQFNFKEFKAEYVGKDDETFQNYVDRDAIIPLVNKVHTFQVLKKAFEDIGNYSDSIIMQREEKRAFRTLTKERANENRINSNNRVIIWSKRWLNKANKWLVKVFLKLNKLVSNKKGDQFILWLNRWSNNYQSDFRNGIWFTLLVTIIFGSITLLFTEAFHNNICFGDYEFNKQAFTKGVRYLFTFLNPTRNLDYLDSLKPTYGGIAYLFDFLGRLAVGYGFYQTIQAFRKFK
ncbi:pentapeptide repeat-containing protein [Polaribacter sejongensis]|nr:pentapeptide repeat-containing protein [Polaribacter sejongensis]